MTIKQKQELIEKLNLAFIESGIALNSKQYTKFFDKAIAKAIETANNGNVSTKQVKDAINQIQISEASFVRQTYNMTVLSGLTNVVEKQKLDQSDLNVFLPLVAISRIFPIGRPQQLVRSVNNVTNAILSRSTKGLTGLEKKSLPFMKDYFNKNQKFIKQQLAVNRRNIKVINAKVKTSISKTIAKELKKQIKMKVPVVKNGEFLDFKRPKTFQEIRKDLLNKFGKEIDYRVKRLVDTELHSLAETTKFDQHLFMGYTHKMWVSTGQANVRNILKGRNKTSHVVMNGKTIPIKSKFNMFGGGQGMHPGDPELPAKDFINCHCSLVYIKR